MMVNVTDSELDAALARGRAAWPELAVPPERFLAALRGAIQDSPDPAAALERLAIEDLYLAQACATGAREALDAFSTRCEPSIEAGLRAMGLRAELIEEVIQEV